jgi:hypothetical protein
MKIYSVFYLLLFLSLSTVSYCQYVEDKEAGISLIDFEKQIDAAIVTADIAFLQNAYADNFRFKHSTGHVDDKASWLKDVEKGKGSILSRTLESVDVEIHDGVGITNGILIVKRKDKTYKLQYVRVYVKKEGQWQMIMHRSVQDLK